MPSFSPANLLSKTSLSKGQAYLNTAAEGLPLDSCLDAVRQYCDAKSQGEPGRTLFWKEYERARLGAARLFSVDLDQIALVSSTTEALNTIAQGIDWRSGDEIVLTSVEFPSNIFPWVALQRRGVRLRIVCPGNDGVSMDELLENINARTRLVTFSQVSYATGEQLNPEPVWRRAQGTRTLLCIDATQAAGRVPVRGDLADFTVASAFKWLNSLHGTAILSVSRRVLQDDILGPAGWFSAESCFADDRLEAFHPRADAQRFQAGMPNFDSIYAVAAALDFHTPQRVKDQHADQASEIRRLREQLLEMGLKASLPEAESRQAGIVAFACPAAAQWKQELAQEGIFVQGDDGRIRAAMHWYNTAGQIDQYLAGLQRLRDRQSNRTFFSTQKVT